MLWPQCHPAASQCRAERYEVLKRGVAAGRSAQRACERSSDWRRGARRAPPNRINSRCLYSALPPTFGRADLHLHTLASDGLMSACDLVDHVEQHTDLDVIAVTDHDETSASLE